eukprot:3936867-Prymnesium_polylepis.1
MTATPQGPGGRMVAGGTPIVAAKLTETCTDVHTVKRTKIPCREMSDGGWCAPALENDVKGVQPNIVPNPHADHIPKRERTLTKHDKTHRPHRPKYYLRTESNYHSLPHALCA